MQDLIYYLYLTGSGPAYIQGVPKCSENGLSLADSMERSKQKSFKQKYPDYILDNRLTISNFDYIVDLYFKLIWTTRTFVLY